MTQERASEKPSRAADYDGIVASLKRPIVLIGMMGSGKTRLAAALSAATGLPAIDSDSEIEVAAGCTVEEYIERHGIADFRKGEERVIARLLDGGVKIISTGGGAILSDTTRASLKEKAITVWLQASVKTLATRVGDGSKRPLLKNHDPETRLGEILAERAPLYTEAADFTVNSDYEDINETLREFRTGLKPFL